MRHESMLIRFSGLPVDKCTSDDKRINRATKFQTSQLQKETSYQYISYMASERGSSFSGNGGQFCVTWRRLTIDRRWSFSESSMSRLIEKGEALSREEEQRRNRFGLLAGFHACDTGAGRGKVDAYERCSNMQEPR